MGGFCGFCGRGCWREVKKKVFVSVWCLIFSVILLVEFIYYFILQYDFFFFLLFNEIIKTMLFQALELTWYEINKLE